MERNSDETSSWFWGWKIREIPTIYALLFLFLGHDDKSLHKHNLKILQNFGQNFVTLTLGLLLVNWWDHKQNKTT